MTIKLIKTGFIIILGCFTSPLITGCTMHESLNQKTLNELLHTLKTQQEFIKAHAAEYLIWTGHPEEPENEFLKEDSLHGTEPRYRIVIWRVLAEAAGNSALKAEWGNKVLDVFGDLQSPDRLHAAETLAKLKISPLAEFPDATQKSLLDDSRNLQVYTLWAESFSSVALMNENRSKFLHFAIADTNEIIRKISAYVLRNIKGLTVDQWDTLADQALGEPSVSGLQNSLLNTAYITFPAGIPENAVYSKIKEEMLKDYQHFPAAARIELAQVLAEKGTRANLPLLISLLDNENITGIYEAGSPVAADVRAAAAYAILKINMRSE